MAWIDTIPDDSWHGELAELRSTVRDDATDRVDHIMSIHSLNPRGMAAHQTLYESAMSGTKTLRRVERELIAVVVSQINGCHY